MLVNEKIIIAMKKMTFTCMLSNVEVFILEHNTMTNFREASDTEVILILHVNPCFISCLVLPLSFLDT